MSVGDTFVLDTSSLLAYFFEEPGADLTEKALDGRCHMSLVNWAEVLSKLTDTGHDTEQFERSLRQEGILGKMLILEHIDSQDCLTIARLHPLTRHLGLGLGDRACLALGKRLNLPVLTADKQWATLNIGVTVNLIR